MACRAGRLSVEFWLCTWVLVCQAQLGVSSSTGSKRYILIFFRYSILKSGHLLPENNLHPSISFPFPFFGPFVLANPNSTV